MTNPHHGMPSPARQITLATLALLLVTILAGCQGSPTYNAAMRAASTNNGTTTGADDTASSTTDAPAPGPLTICDSATYPSLAWTQCEAENIAATTENITGHVSLLPGLAAATLQYQKTHLTTILTDPGRRPDPNPCTTIVLCPIDPRVQNWKAAGGLVEPVLFTSRSGGTLSGHVWATKSGPARRPGVVIINGSIIGYEQIYWYAAQALAKAGFVVMTFDSQGEGMSDQFGETPDQNEDAFAGTPALGLLGSKNSTGQGLGGNGLPFYDGGEDALNFFLSTPGDPYVPVPSRSTGTSHDAKQQRRVAAGLNNAYNPLWQLLDPTRIGLAGHSYGAVAASYLAQSDARVSAAVAWDNICVPVSPSPDEASALLDAPINNIAGIPAPALRGLSVSCFGAPAGPAPAITTPVLGITADYLLPAPYVRPPGPEGKAQASLAYTKAGVDTGTLVIRGGTHLDFTDAPGVLPATLRGIDMVTWYTVAWFRKYLQHDPAADAMLLTARWRNDAQTAAVDPAGDPNLFSWHYRSRLDIGLANGARFDCENLRKGCGGQVKAADDGGPAHYSFVSVDTAPETP